MTKYWARLSASERRLAAITAILAGGFIAALTAYQALAQIWALDDDIVAAQEQLVDLTMRCSARDAVQKAFQEIATEHSSSWTQVEIHDRLRREIYRLALKTPPPPGVDAAATGSLAGEKLIDIPSLGEGRLTESGKGYREYQIAFDAQPASIRNVITFVRRLMESPQALRVQSIDLRRNAANSLVQASFSVTRTVVDSVQGNSVEQKSEAAPAASSETPATTGEGS